MIKNLKYLVIVEINIMKYITIILLFISSICYGQSNEPIMTEKQYFNELEIVKLYHLEKDYVLIAFSIYDLSRGIALTGRCVDLTNTDVHVHTTFILYDNVTGDVNEYKRSEVMEALLNNNCSDYFIETYDGIQKMLEEL